MTDYRLTWCETHRRDYRVCRDRGFSESLPDDRACRPVEGRFVPDSSTAPCSEPDEPNA